MSSEVVTYKGVRFRRYPDAKHRTERVYFTPGIADRQRGVRRLHEEIWQDAYGPIPEGAVIHHVDGDPLNNAVTNLRCITPVEHAAEHQTDDLVERQRAHAARIRPLAKAWHASEEGREWHRQHAREVFRNQPDIAKVCEQCGEEYRAPQNAKDFGRFCSNACKSAWRRAAGVDDETRTCPVCNEDFRVNRYSKKRCCSRSCAGALRRAISSS